MIIAAYGVPGITVVELALMFNKLNLTYGLVISGGLKKVGPTLDITETDSCCQPAFPVIFNSHSTFLRTHGKFKRIKVIAFIVDNPVVLTRSLKIPLLGAYSTKHLTTFSRVGVNDIKEILIGCTYKDTPIEVSNKKYKPVDEILKSYEQSDLAKIQTFLYKIKDIDHRERVSKLIKNWLLTSTPFSKIEGRLQKEIKPRIVDVLKVMLTQLSIDNLRVAIRQVKNNKLSPGKASKQFKISAFDLRYLLATTTHT